LGARIFVLITICPNVFLFSVVFAWKYKWPAEGRNILGMHMYIGIRGTCIKNYMFEFYFISQPNIRTN
jgi:hypothetical protein